MNRNEKHVHENESVAKRESEHMANADQIAKSIPAKGRNEKREHTRKINRLWLWLGVLILIFILLYWLFSIGIMEDLLNVFNG